jgi:hypothetical protein
MKKYFGFTLKGIGYLGLLGLVIGVFSMLYTLYQIHGLFWAILSIIILPVAALIPLYLWLQHGISEFMFQVYLYPFIAALLYNWGKDLVDDEEKPMIEIGLAITLLIGIGFFFGLMGY